MKLDILSREIVDITIYDDEVAVAMEIKLSHGSVRKIVSSIKLEHIVRIAPLLPTDDEMGIDDAITLAIAGIKQRAEVAIAALRGLSSL